MYRIIYYDPIENIYFSIYLPDYLYHRLVGLAEIIATRPRGYIRVWESEVRRVYRTWVPPELRGKIPFRFFAYGWLLWKLVRREAEHIEEGRYRYSYAIDFKIPDTEATIKTPGGTIFSIRTYIITQIPLDTRSEVVTISTLRKVARFISSLFPSLYYAVYEGKVMVREGIEKAKPTDKGEIDIFFDEAIRGLDREAVRKRCTRVAERLRRGNKDFIYWDRTLRRVEEELGYLKSWGKYGLSGTPEERRWFILDKIDVMFGEAVKLIPTDYETAGRMLMTIVFYHVTSDPEIKSWNFGEWAGISEGLSL